LANQIPILLPTVSVNGTARLGKCKQ